MPCCTYCHAEKPIEEFRKGRLHCKPCHNANSRAYHLKHQEECNTKSRLYYAEHRVEQNANRLLYYYAHREEQLAAHRQWHAEHREEANLRSHLYYYAHREEQLVVHHTYYVTNRERMLAWQRQYNALHKEEKRAYRLKRLGHIRKTIRFWRQTHREHIRVYDAGRRALKAGMAICDLTTAQWREIQAHYHYKCVYCHRKIARLTMDHLLAISQGGQHTASNIVPACKSCNSRKKDRPPMVPVQPMLLTVAPSRAKNT